jgi:hypothetical protein
MPAMLGLITGVISAGGQPQPYSAIYKSMAKLEGGNTRIFARPQTTPGKPSERRVFKSEKRDYGHQLRQLRLIVFSDQSYEIDLQNQLYPLIHLVIV